MYIRAGIIYQLINRYLSKEIYRELIYWSNYSENNSFYYDMYYVLTIMESDFYYQAPIDFDLECYYPGRSKQILELFGGCTQQDVHDAVSYYIYEYRMILEEEKMYIIPENPTNTWFGTIGKDMETTTKIILSSIYGFTIDEIQRSFYTIPDTNINIAGKADGYIRSSPGGIYNGYVLECKYVQNRCKIAKVMTQIACYNKIYGCPVLLAILTGNEIKLFSYSSITLAKHWANKIVTKLVDVCSEIDQKILIKNIEDVPDHIEFMVS